MTPLYVIGDLVRCRAVFRDPDNGDALIDPATIIFKAKAPSGTITTLTYGVDVGLVKESTGRYRADVSAATAGQWSYRFETTGTYQAAQEGTFTISAGAF